MTVARITKYHALRAIAMFARMAACQTRVGHPEDWAGEERPLVEAVLAKANEVDVDDFAWITAEGRRVGGGTHADGVEAIDLVTPILKAHTDRDEIQCVSEMLVWLAKLVQFGDREHGEPTGDGGEVP